MITREANGISVTVNNVVQDILDSSVSFVHKDVGETIHVAAASEYSWVEVHYGQNNSWKSSGGGIEHIPSSSSIHQEDMEKILLDAQLESEKNSSKGSSHSGSSLVNSPQPTHHVFDLDGSTGERTSIQSEEDWDENTQDVEVLAQRPADWIWDWSSRPENLPPKEFFFRHPSSTLSSTLSIRKTSVMKKGGLFSSEILLLFIPSLVLTHLLTLGIGIYIGKKLSASPANAL
ncbi:BCL2/adenovirus E1B 19 kDa protein-interacting protein 3-like [Protopterus annectens]|uniref:BCL2/adenovirus E1B 19 kDa protein-interacting protein 3-like n=1 Tax=Protopterus annectens TaxID=7888 RepID=UPI001CFBF584|nr:BCL2/adenovirus E1B 19 kDa protein-interacting protein 3-like [Protopterus annectens]